MQSASSARGLFVWHELLTTDMSAAAAFYGKVVGWDTVPFGQGNDGPPYLMWHMPGARPIGGLTLLPEQAAAMGAPPHWMGNLCVADVDAAVKQVEALGGKVYMGGFDVPEVGRVAVVADPAGAVLAFFQPVGEAPGHANVTSPGEFAWAELMSTDPDAVWPFYESIAGWTKGEAMDMGPGGTYQIFHQGGGQSIGGIMRSPPGMPMSAWGYYTHVANLDESIATAKANGANLLNGPMPVPGGMRVANLQDPQGAMFAVIGA